MGGGPGGARAKRTENSLGGTTRRKSLRGRRKRRNAGSKNSRRLVLTRLSAEIPRQKTAPRTGTLFVTILSFSLAVTSLHAICYRCRHPFDPPHNEWNRYRTAYSQVSADSVILSTDSVSCRGGRTIHSRVNSLRGLRGMRVPVLFGMIHAAARTGPRAYWSRRRKRRKPLRSFIPTAQREFYTIRIAGPFAMILSIRRRHLPRFLT